MADAESLRRWWWPGSTIGKPRRGMVDRRTATLMYAGRNRRSATPRKVPQAKRAPARWWPSQSTHGLGPAATAPRRSLRLVVTLAPISAVTVGQQASFGRHLRPQEPGELPAIAVATTFLESLRAASRRKRPHSRSWAAHARATTWGPGPAGGRAGRPRPPGGASRPRPTQASWARRWALPHLVMWPRHVEVPLEYSEGTRPQTPVNAAARPNRRQSPTSLARVNAPSRVMPR